VQIQVLLVAEGVRVGAVVSRSNIGSNAEVVKLQAFNGTAGNISEFLTVCKLFIKIRMRNDSVEKLIQWMCKEDQWIFGRRMYWNIWNQET